MGFFKEVMDRSTVPADASNANVTAGSSIYNTNSTAGSSIYNTNATAGSSSSIYDGMDLQTSYQTPGRSIATQALARTLEAQGTFSWTLPGEVSPSPPTLEQPCERVFELGDDTPRTAKRMKLCIEEASNESGLDKKQIKAAEKFAKLHKRQRDTVLFIKMQSIEKLLQSGAQQTQSPEAPYAALLLDSSFRSYLQTKIIGCLLSPDITKYLGGVSGALMSLIQREPDLFNIPEKLFEHQTLISELQSMVIDGLASARGSIKTKLKESLGRKKKGAGTGPQPIYTLCSSLAPPGMEIKVTHWARVAYLRYCFVKFQVFAKEPPTTNSAATTTETMSSAPNDTHSDAAATDTDANMDTDTPANANASANTNTSAAANADPSKPPRSVKAFYRKTHFWRFVDDSLSDVRLDAKEAGVTRIGQRQKLSEFFQVILKEDMTDYASPNTFKTPAQDTTAVVTAWQCKLDRAIAF
ncbi:hypothetical protein E1B28_010892 [Marasmius oreades]|uniref:Uncharacterized protein n=1 Tax=Marasmius oreades TaxID=181124 RepID=A0A9P7RT35_9AGAR|nr:uncharacterized protein E1B28_010892 [Marasmius oreades]KAG7089190.1 hypothetical protein E1B28_010892 [Marasmius oreades]